MSVDFLSCKGILHSFIPVLTSKSHYKANSSSLKGKRFSLKWNINLHVHGIDCLKSKLPSPLCAYTIDPVIGLTGIKKKNVISFFSQINSVWPLPKASAVEAIPAVSSHENAFAMIEQEEEEHQKITGNAQIKLDHIFLEDSTEVEYRESMRRKKIGQANKGKVRQKIVQSRHPHRNSTKARIDASVKLRRDQLHNRKLLQQTCIREWEESIAEAARRGGNGDKKLNWNSYETLKAKMKQELFPARKKNIVKMENKSINKTANKSYRHKLKISQEMKAKCADPNYQQRHQPGTHKFHGSTAQALSEKITNGENSSKLGKSMGVQESTGRNSEALHLPSDATNKAMLNIRTATERARSLIAETEKAAKMLEPVAAKDLSVRSSLFEAHKHLAEAIQSLRKTEAWTNSMERILLRHDVASINVKGFQLRYHMNNSVLSESELLGHGTVNDVKSRFEESQYTLEQSMPFSDQEITSSGKHRTSSNSGFEVRISESESIGMLESEPMENIESNDMSSIKPDSEVFNSPFMVDEHNTEGTVGNLEARTETNIKMDGRFDQEKKSVGSSLTNSGERPSSVKHDFLTSRKRGRRWFRGRLVDIEDE
ncbi:hypothetical protein KI387_037850 [Taxus chinensis]|uniref:Nuclease associated modular domain-containing protein n=1 Tax=Taxus chinensis TaxID=29808 RepID=A0AA38FTD9_TAXCH|nr:hypothetical protein KI387_037850 [Taxus chinensis]